jgi:hypothetical protein
MGVRSVAFGLLTVLAAAVVWAAEVEVHGHLYGAVVDDFAEGDVGPISIPEPAGGEGGADDILKDGDPMYNFRLEADVMLRANFDEDVAANLEFTFDDRKQSTFYQYLLLEPEEGQYYLTETGESKYVYGSLEQVNVEWADIGGATGLTLGGFDIRYGHGGYYNQLVNRIDPVSFVAYLDPFGARASRAFGPVNASLSVGAGLERQAVVAADCRVRNFGLFFATEGRTYDLKSLWDTHYAPAIPKFWRHLYWREHALAPEPRGELGTLGDTFHAGVEGTWKYSAWDLYTAIAYHVFADEAGAENPTGGKLIQFYPDFGVRVIGPRLWLRGAALYEAWRANYYSAFGDAIDTNDYLLLFGEPQFFLTENLFFGVGGRYVNPSRRTPDSSLTTVREDTTLSLAFIPHLSYAPNENVKIDLTYAETWWDPSYDLVTTGDFEENRGRDLKLEIEAAF